MINIEKFEKAYFNIDLQDEYYEGYHIPSERWNGWAVPYFVKEVIDKLINAMQEHEIKIVFDEKNEKYIVSFKDSDEIEEYTKEIIETAEGKKEVYSVGGGSWIWYEYSFEDAQKETNSIIFTSNSTIKKTDINMELEY